MDKQSNKRNENNLDDMIVAARTQHDAEQIEAASQRVLQSIAEKEVAKPSQSTPALRWVLPLAAALALALFLPVFLPDSGSAFAKVQQWFERFDTMQVTVAMDSGSGTNITTRVWINEVGDVRIESGAVTNLLLRDQAIMYTLLPGNRYFSQSLPPEADDVAPQSMQWLDEIRAFQGEAQLLEQTKLVDGQRAAGYRLRIAETDMTLWASQDTNQPLLMETVFAENMVMTVRFAFNEALPDGIFALPNALVEIESESGGQ